MNRYVRYGVCTLEQILPLVATHYGTPNLPKPVFHGHKVGVSSLRMKTFEHDGVVCRACGLEATFFAVEDFVGATTPQPHLNLYGVNDEDQEVLFTHDHRLARALGGANDLSNVQTMCSPCNNKKGRAENPQKKKKREAKLGENSESEFQFEKSKPDLESETAILDVNPTQESA